MIPSTRARNDSEKPSCSNGHRARVGQGQIVAGEDVFQAVQNRGQHIQQLMDLGLGEVRLTPAHAPEKVGEMRLGQLQKTLVHQCACLADEKGLLTLVRLLKMPRLEIAGV
jgi:hypothetical protein